MIGKRIEELRKQQGLSQKELSIMAGISAPGMSQIENGKRYPSLTTFARIARVLNISMQGLYYGDRGTIESRLTKLEKQVDQIASRPVQYRPIKYGQLL